MGKPPFYLTSVDFFGPIGVLVLRNKIEKRWGAIFTCMTVRAVHVEIAPSLFTSDFLNILRNFINLRGKPHQIYCYNESNFVWAKNLLESLQYREANEPESVGSTRIQWKFQPPGAPQRGGVNEPLVKSAKQVMINIIEGEQKVRRNLRDYELRTGLSPRTGHPSDPL